MESRNVETHRAGHEAFNRRDFGAMVKEYEESIRWIDQARGATFSTPDEFKSDFLADGSAPLRTAGSPTPGTRTPATAW